MRPIAPNAFLRPCQRRARSASSRATRTVRAPLDVQIDSIVATSCSSPAAAPSTSMRSTAAASVG